MKHIVIKTFACFGFMTSETIYIMEDESLTNYLNNYDGIEALYVDGKRIYDGILNGEKELSLIDRLVKQACDNGKIDVSKITYCCGNDLRKHSYCLDCGRKL